MPLARIITSTPALAKDVSRALKHSGYTVEIVSPSDVPGTLADLEIDLDLQNGIAWRPDDFPAPAAVEPDYYEEYAPVEREFVLAPLWRKLTSHMHDRWQSIRPKRTELVDLDLDTEATEELQPPALQQQPPPAEQQPVPLPVTVPTSVIEMPSPSRQKGPSMLSVTLIRCRNQFSAALAAATAFLSRTQQTASRTALAAKSLAKARFDQLRHAFSTRKRQPLRPAPYTQVMGTAQFTQVVGAAKRKTTHDYYLFRQLWPVAAGILLAFVLGWTASRYNNIPVRQLTPQKDLAGGGVTVFSGPMAKTHARKRVPGAPLAQKPSASRRSSRNSDQDVDDEVTVRRYPARAVAAKSQPLGPKHYSDLE